MRHRILAAVFPLACVILLAPGCAQAPAPSPIGAEEPVLPPVRLVAVSWRGEFFAQDPADDYLVPVGHTGFTRINSLTVTADDRILAVAQRDDSTPAIIEIDPDTGRGALVCALDRPADVRGLAASPSGALHAVMARYDGKSGSEFAEIDPATGRVITLGDTDVTGIQALEYCPHGELYAVVNNPKPAKSENSTNRTAVVRIDTTDWSLYRIGDFSTFDVIQSLAFDCTDTGVLSWRENMSLDIGSNPIMRIDVDPDTHALTFTSTVASLRGADIRGIGYLHLRQWWDRCCASDPDNLPVPFPPPITEEPTR